MNPFVLIGVRRLLLVLLIGIGVSGPIAGHEVRPALLQITERPGGRYDILWKQPVTGTMAVHLEPRLSGVLPEHAADAVQSAPDFQIHEWRDLDLGEHGLEGRTLEIEGLSRTITDALLSITLANGDSVQKILHPQDPELTLSVRKTGIAVAAYFRLGVMHILTGFDHQCFVLALMLLVRRRWMLVKTLTAFTVAHSITLAATALRWITVQPALVEALVALSILFVAVELARAAQGEATLTGRHPWVIAFTFGLLHGSAFAGALVDVGLPPNAITASLVLFNVGVEGGQLLFVAAVLGIHRLLRAPRTEWPTWSRWVPPYAIGSLSAVWFLQRLVAAAN